MTKMIHDKDPYSSKDFVRALQDQLIKNPPRDNCSIKREIVSNINFALTRGSIINPNSRILDIGCGVGDSVGILLELGYDAFGVDVLELWDKDFDQYWEERKKPEGPHLSRLFAIDADNYVLPFPDNYFDYVFSDQVFEHVYDYEVVFKEISRVLKSGSISTHRFPGPNQIVEGHINVPMPILCKNRFYLKIWALLGRRSNRQSNLDWRQTLTTNIEMMNLCHYPTKQQLLHHAQKAGVKISFLETEEIKHRKFGRISRILKITPPFLKNTLASAASLISQRYMIIEGK